MAEDKSQPDQGEDQVEPWAEVTLNNDGQGGSTTGGRAKSKTKKGRDKKPEAQKGPDILAGCVIGPYLVVHIMFLSVLALWIWIAPDLLSKAPPLPTALEVLRQYIQDDNFRNFQNVVLAACAAGLGGAVFMVREFYINFAYGKPIKGQGEDESRENKEGQDKIVRKLFINFSCGEPIKGQDEDESGKSKERQDKGASPEEEPRKYLENKEIPRYILLPFSSVVLGPIALSLLLAGSIVFFGFTGGKEVPHFSAIAVSFLLGFTYHDTLSALRKLSRRVLDKEDNRKTE